MTVIIIWQQAREKSLMKKRFRVRYGAAQLLRRQTRGRGVRGAGRGARAGVARDSRRNPLAAFDSI